MGNYKFRLSDMMPNAWFYKLKDMGNKPRNQASKKKPPPAPPSSSSSSSLSSSSTTTTSLSFSSKTKPRQNQSQPHHHCRSRKSYYFTRDLNNANDDERLHSSPTTTPNPKPSPPRKSSKQRLRRRRPTKSSSSPSPKLFPLTITGITTTTTSSSVSSGFSCKAKLESVFTKPVMSLSSSSSSPLCSSPEKEIPGDPEFRCDRILTTFDGMVSSTCRCHHQEEENCGKENDVVIDVDKASLLSRKTGVAEGFDSFPELELPPIITKPKKKQDTNLTASAVVPVKEQSRSSTNTSTSSFVRKFSSPNNNSSSHGVKLRIHSPRIVGKRVSGRKSVSGSNNSSSGDHRLKKRSLSESFAIVKSSFDPQKDFRESMVEMIVENNIRASKDLEDLLACYLSLNSDEYHDIIIKVFKQIWFDLTDLNSK